MNLKTKYTILFFSLYFIIVGILILISSQYSIFERAFFAFIFPVFLFALPTSIPRILTGQIPEDYWEYFWTMYWDGYSLAALVYWVSMMYLGYKIFKLSSKEIKETDLFSKEKLYLKTKYGVLLFSLYFIFVILNLCIFEDYGHISRAFFSILFPVFILNLPSVLWKMLSGDLPENYSRIFWSLDGYAFMALLYWIFVIYIFLKIVQASQTKPDP